MRFAKRTAASLVGSHTDPIEPVDRSEGRRYSSTEIEESKRSAARQFRWSGCSDKRSFVSWTVNVGPAFSTEIQLRYK